MKPTASRGCRRMKSPPKYTAVTCTPLMKSSLRRTIWPRSSASVASGSPSMPPAMAPFDSAAGTSGKFTSTICTSVTVRPALRRAALSQNSVADPMTLTETRLPRRSCVRRMAPLSNAVRLTTSGVLTGGFSKCAGPTTRKSRPRATALNRAAPKPPTAASARPLARTANADVPPGAPDHPGPGEISVRQRLLLHPQDDDLVPGKVQRVALTPDPERRARIFGCAEKVGAQGRRLGRRETAPPSPVVKLLRGLGHD